MVSGDGHGGHDTDSTSTIGGNDAGSTSTKGGNDAGSTSTTTSAAAAAKVLQANAAMFNQDFYNYIFIVCASLVAFMFVWRVGMESIKYVRTLTCLNNEYVYCLSLFGTISWVPRDLDHFVGAAAEPRFKAPDLLVGC